MGALDEFSERQRKIWSSGDFGTMAPTIEQVSQLIVDLVGAGEGHDFLDVATGTGNAALIAASRGARATGLDFVPDLLAQASGRATAGGLDVKWVEGDTQSLPFAKASFDRVVSVFGAMFAPRHGQTASELVRVTRPGGCIAAAAWTPEGLNGELFGVIGTHMPRPPPEIEAPVLWGDVGHVRSLFEGPGLEVTCERRTVPVEAESVEAWVEFCERSLGPMVVAKTVLEPQGRWDQARAEVVDLYQHRNEASDGTLHAPAEYLLTTCRLAA